MGQDGKTVEIERGRHLQEGGGLREYELLIKPAAGYRGEEQRKTTTMPADKSDHR